MNMKFQKNKMILNIMIYIIALIIILITVGCFNTNSIPDKTPPNVITKNVLFTSNQIEIDNDFNFQLKLYIEDLRNQIQTLTINTLLQKPNKDTFSAVTDSMTKVNNKTFEDILDLTILSLYLDEIGEYTFKVFITTFDNKGNGATVSTNEFTILVNNQ
jgi:hypothetical protein